MIIVSHKYVNNNGEEVCTIIELSVTAKDAESCSIGGCDNQPMVEALLKKPYIKRQVESWDKEALNKELREYGVWDDAERQDHNQNICRMVWIACGDIVEGK